MKRFSFDPVLIPQGTADVAIRSLATVNAPLERVSTTDAQRLAATNAKFRRRVSYTTTIVDDILQRIRLRLASFNDEQPRQAIALCFREQLAKHVQQRATALGISSVLIYRGVTDADSRMDRFTRGEYQLAIVMGTSLFVSFQYLHLIPYL